MRTTWPQARLAGRGNRHTETHCACRGNSKADLVAKMLRNGIELYEQKKDPPTTDLYTEPYVVPNWTCGFSKAISTSELFGAAA